MRHFDNESPLRKTFTDTAPDNFKKKSVNLPLTHKKLPLAKKPLAPSRRYQPL